MSDFLKQILLFWVCYIPDNFINSRNFANYFLHALLPEVELQSIQPCGEADVNMGKRKHGFNWKARQQKETNVDRSAEKKVSCQRLKISTCKHKVFENEMWRLKFFPNYLFLMQADKLMCLVLLYESKHWVEVMKTFVQIDQNLFRGEISNFIDKI